MYQMEWNVPLNMLVIELFSLNEWLYEKQNIHCVLFAYVLSQYYVWSTLILWACEQIY